MVSTSFALDYVAILAEGVDRNIRINESTVCY